MLRPQPFPLSDVWSWLGEATLGGALGPALGAMAKASLLDVLPRWQIGSLHIHLPDGSTLHAGRRGDPLRATLWIEQGSFFRKLALQGPQWIGESYMDGDWRADDLARFLEIAMLNHAALPERTPLTRIANAVNRGLHRGAPNTRAGSRQNIRRHYDLSNDLFALFLDDSMTYSAAIYEAPAEPLEAAQANKYRAFGQKLGLGPADHVLEIGCGWGGFAIFAAREYGCRVTGLTISGEQLALARERVRAAGLHSRIDIRLCDYRDAVTLAGVNDRVNDGAEATGSSSNGFSKIVSIEMLEAVGREQWEQFFGVCDRVLAPGGAIALQTIAVPDHHFEEHARHAHWVQKYIFPGGLLPSLAELRRAAMDGAGLGIHHVEDIGPHYARTLAAWREKFMRHLPHVRSLGFDDRFIRMWEFYLAGSEAGFRTHRLQDLQLVLARSQ